MVNQWEIYLCAQDPAQGSEQCGTRPVLVLSNNGVNRSIPVSTVAPFSSVKPGARIYPTEIFVEAARSGLPKDSVVMVQQLRALSHQRLTRLIARLDDESARKEIREALLAYFDL